MFADDIWFSEVITMFRHIVGETCGKFGGNGPTVEWEKIRDIATTTTWDDHRLQSAAKVFNPNKWILCDSRIANTETGILWLFQITGCLLRSRTQKYLHTWFTWFCFCCLQRHFLRSVVGPLPHVDWTQTWRESFQQWNGRIQRFCGTIGMQTLVWNGLTTPRGTQPILHCWWLKRGLHWNPWGRLTGWTPEKFLGQHPCKFFRLKNAPSWEIAAVDHDLWSSMLLYFFISPNCNVYMTRWLPDWAVRC